MHPDLAWLTQPVPLWALLIAMLTNPYAWSDRITSRLTPLLNKLLPTQG